MDVAQSGHVFQQPLAPPSVEKGAILQQQSVIQSNQQLQQQLQSMHDNNEENRQKSREILTRRPSYR
jgi:pKID domain.